MILGLSEQVLVIDLYIKLVLAAGLFAIAMYYVLVQRRN